MSSSNLFFKDKTFCDKNMPLIPSSRLPLLSVHYNVCEVKGKEEDLAYYGPYT
jgi:hypothetical protein